MRALALAMGLWAASPGAAPAGPLDVPGTHRYAIVDQQVADVLREFAAAIGVVLTLGQGVEGRLTNFAGTYDARGFLDAVTAEFGLVWYDDGAAIHVSAASEMTSVVIDFEALSPAELEAAMKELGIADPRFALRETSAGIGVVTGPPRYVELVENAFLMLRARAAAERSAPAAPRAGSDAAVQAHAITVVRGERVSIWRGAAAQAAADAEATAGAAEPEVDR